MTKPRPGDAPSFALVIIIAVSIAIVIAASYWFSSIAFLFTRYEDVRPVYFDNYGPIVEMGLINRGTATSYIENCWLNDRYRADIVDATDRTTGQSAIRVGEGGRPKVVIKPGHLATVWVHVPVYLGAGTTYKLKCVTTTGLKIYRVGRTAKPIGESEKIKLVAYTGYSGGENNPVREVVVDPLTWRFTYLYYSAPSQSGERTLIATYTGQVPVLTRVSEAYTTEVNPKSPLVIVINPKAGKEDWNFTWHGPCQSGCIWPWHANMTFHLARINGAVPGMDFLILWEDQWDGAGYNYSGDCYSWLDHVVRVTWKKNGMVEVHVYHASGGYMHEFWVGGKKLYTKGHGEVIDCCECGPSCGGICNSCSGNCTSNSCGYYLPSPCLSIGG